MIIKAKTYFFHIILGLVVLVCANFWKIQIAFGQHSFLFTALNILGPLLGTMTGPWVILVTLLCKRFIGWNFFGLSLINAFSTYIPTLFAAWYWNIPSRVIRLFLPIFCIIAFIIHPIGFQAAIYSLYWLIPIAIYFLPHKTFFLHTLASTFIQHAVGSVIWLYVMPSTPLFWYGLLPIVCVERFLFASGMVVVFYIMQMCRSYVLRPLSFLANQTYTN